MEKHMGDRSNIVVTDRHGSRIYLYGHWMGASALAHAAHGLESGRVGDPPYLTRIIFSSMVKNDIDAETGFGISTYPPDNEYPIIVIDGDTGEVHLEGVTDPIPGTEFISLVKSYGEGEGIEDSLSEEYGDEFGSVVRHWPKTD
jgi:hypothetical protein